MIESKELLDRLEKEVRIKTLFEVLKAIEEMEKAYDDTDAHKVSKADIKKWLRHELGLD